MTIGNLYVTNPVWAWAVVPAVGVPLAVHLLSQRGGRRKVFPTIRWIRRAAAEQARWSRIRHWWLLLLRSTVLILIAAAFSRPVWSHAGSPAGQTGGHFAVLVLDRSASMTRLGQDTTLFDQARRQVIRTLRGLDPFKDIATVILLDQAPRSLLPAPSNDFERLVSLVQQTPPTYQKGDLDAVFRVAVAQTAQIDSGNISNQTPRLNRRKPIHLELFSDLQETQFSEARSLPLALNSAIVRTHRFGNTVSNLALIRPVIQPHRPVLGQRATVTVQVADFGLQDGASDPVAVRLTFEDQWQAQTASVAAGAITSVNFHIEPTRSGPAWIELEVDRPEPFETDNRTGLFFTVEPARHVALVSAADLLDAHSAAYYVTRALAPAVTGKDGPGVELTVWHSDTLGEALASVGPTRTPEMIVMVETGLLDTLSLTALHRYLIAGGAVIWIVDDPHATQMLHRFSQLDPKRGLSPVVPDPTLSWVTGVDLTFASGRFDDPVLHVFEGPARSGLMGMTFSAVMVGTTVPSATLLLSFSDGTPALSTRWVGRGRLAVLGANISPRHSDMVKSPSFLPLVHQLVRHLAPGPVVNGHGLPGERSVVTIRREDLEKQPVARGPDNRVVPLAIRGAMTPTPTVVLGPLERTGPHIVTDVNGTKVVGGVYVQLPFAESDLRVDRHWASRIKHTLGRAAKPVIDNDSEAAGESPSMKTWALWPYLVCVAVLLAAMEPVLVKLWQWRERSEPDSVTEKVVLA